MRKAFRLGLVLLMLLGGSGTAWALEEFKTVVLQSAAGATGNGTAIDTPNYTSIALQVVISNTATVTFEGTVDGTNYVSAVCTSTASTSATLVTTATASGMYQCPVAGFAKFRARVSAWTSGTVTVTARVTTAVLGKKGGGSGGTGASVSDHFVTTTDDTGDIANSFNLGGLTTGILKHSVAAGVSTPATAAAGTDYISPAGVETFATGTKTVTSKFDFGGGTLEIPNSTTLPATCVVGEAYMDTDATSGQRFYLCQSANTWGLQGDGGSGGTNALLDGTAHTDTLAGTVARGDIICGNSTPKWARVARGTNGQLLSIQGSDCTWVDVPTHSFLSSTHSDSTPKTLTGDSANESGGVPMVTDAATAWAFYRPGARTVSGTTDTALITDRWGTVSYSSTSSVAVTLPQAGAGSPLFAPNGWWTILDKSGASGTITITPTTSTINGAASVTLTTQYNGWLIYSNGTNYRAYPLQSGGGSDTNNFTIAQNTTANAACSTLAQNTTYVIATDSCTTSANIFRYVVPVNATLKAVYWKVTVGGTAGTASQAVTHFTRKNDTTSTSGCTTTDYNAVDQSCNETGLSVSYSAGDTLEFKVTTPTVWTTPATGVRWQMTAYFSVP